MGSNCCRPKGQSPKVSLRKIFSRWSHRISRKSDTVKIADAEGDRKNIKRTNSIVVADPVFEAPETMDRNHVTMLHADPPRTPPKKVRLHNKRVSFQSDVEIMRTASSKSLERFTVTVLQEEPKPRSKSCDSFFDVSTVLETHESLKKRRTSSLDNLTIEEISNATSITAKLRRDTLGDALDFQAYKRPLTLPTPEGPVIEEEPDDSSDEEVISSFKLAAKLRRDTLGDALLLASKSKCNDETPTGSSTEDLEETVKHSRLCSKLRRDTFGDALRQAVHCKACSSLEDITELEVPFPGTPEEDENDEEDDIESAEKPYQDNIVQNPPPATTETKIKAKQSNNVSKSAWFKSDVRCKTCMSLEVNSQDLCVVCSSNENIQDLPNGIDEIQISHGKMPKPKIKIFGPEQNTNNPPSGNSTPISPAKQLVLTDAEISQTLDKIRTTGKVEPKEPYNLVYSSSIKGPFASSKENINKDDSGKSSSTDSLEVGEIKKNDILNAPDKGRNQLVS